MKTGLVAGFLFAAATLLRGETPDQVRAWLEAVDATRNAFEQAIISARASQVAGGTVSGTAEFDIYTKGRDRGLIVFRGGKNDGRKILNSGNRMWLLVPGTRNPVPITANQRLVGGASMGDLARMSFSEDYTAALRPAAEDVDGRPCRVLDLTARSPRAPYPKVVLWLDVKEKRPCRAVFSLPSGKPAKDVVFRKFAVTAGRTVVSEMEIRDLLSKGSAVTRLEYLRYRPASIDDAAFTPEGARGL